MNEVSEGILRCQPALPPGITIIDVINPDAAEAFVKVGNMIDKLNKQQDPSRHQINDGSQGQGEVPIHPNGVDNFREFPSSEETPFILTTLQAPVTYPTSNRPVPTIQTPAISAPQGDQFFSPFSNNIHRPPQFVQNYSAEDRSAHTEENDEISDFQCVDEQWVPNSVPPVVAPHNEMIIEQKHTPVLPPLNETFQGFSLNVGSAFELGLTVKAGKAKKKDAYENLSQSIQKKGKSNKKQLQLSIEALVLLIKDMEADPNHDGEELKKLKNNLACRNHRDKKKNLEVKKESELEAIKRENESLKRETRLKDERIKKLVDVLNDVSNERIVLSEKLSQKITRVTTQVNWI